MITETVSYMCGQMPLKGFLAYEESREKKPLVVIAHAWRGLDDFTKDKAKLLAKWGYVAFAADAYGNGVVAESDSEAAELMAPLFIDRKLLRMRIQAAVDAAKQFPQVDAKKVGAIGFCFGGLTVIELLRSGANLKGYVSIHGVYGNKVADFAAHPAPVADALHGSLLMLHGHDDPLNPIEDSLAIQKEFNDRDLDWQMHIFGNTFHAFTNPHANNPANGLLFNEKAARRTWQTVHLFLEEIFI